MSWRVAGEVWKHSRARGSAKFVLLALADYADDDERACWPSITSLVRKTGLSKDTVRRAMHTLEEMGEIEVTRQGGGHQSGCYAIQGYENATGSKMRPVAKSDRSRSDTGSRTRPQGYENATPGVAKCDPNLLRTDHEPLPAAAGAKADPARALIPETLAGSKATNLPARDLAQLAFRQPVKPSLRSKGDPFCAVQRIIADQLSAGTDPTLIEAAILHGVDVWTKAGLQVALAKAKQLPLPGQHTGQIVSMT